MAARPIPALRLVLPALLLAACDSSYEAPAFPPIVVMTVDATGGVLEITEGELAGTRLEIPADALQQPTQISIGQDFALAHPGFLLAGRAVRIGPPGTRFLRPATLTLPYSAGAAFAVPVLSLDAPGRIVEIAQTSADIINNLVVADIMSLATFWPVERFFAGVANARFFPLADGNSWLLDNELTITMEASTSEPNTQRPVFKTLFERPGFRYGIYLEGRTVSGPVDLGGEFVPDGSGSYQQVHDRRLFMPANFTDGQAMRGGYRFTGHQPYGSTAPSYTGTTVVELLPDYVEELTTPLGIFRDLRRLFLRRVHTADDGTQRSIEMTLTLARNVGPVAVEIDGTESRLISGTVSGSPIEPP